MVIAAAATAMITSEAQERDRDASLMRLANFISEKISLQVSAWLGQSDAGGDYFGIAGSLDPGQMLELQKQLEDSIPAVRFASFVPRVSDEERSNHVSQMRALGFTDYEIKDLTADKHPVKSPIRPDYYPAVVPGVEGWDMGSDPDIGPIIKELRFSDDPLSKILTIRVGHSLESELVVFYPVHESQDQSGLKNLRNQELSGLFVIGLDPSVLIGVVVDGLEDQVVVEILLENSLVPASTTDYLYRSVEFETLEGRIWEETIPVEGEVWIIRVKEASALPGRWPFWLLPTITAMVALSALAIGGINLVLVQQRKEAVEAANRLRELGEAKDHILGTVTHELKTPLTSIQAFADILRKNRLNHLDERELSQLDIISRNSVHLNMLIDDVLDVSRLNAGALNLEIVSFEIREFVDEIQAELDPILSDKKQSVIVAIESTEARLSADRHRVEQVLSNLISNASKYSDEGSTIWVTVSNAGGNTVFTVRDEGIGMSTENLRRIGEPFFRVDSEQSRKVGGTGLGIYVAKSIVELHGGIMKFTSELGVGTSVELSFPAKNDLVTVPRDPILGTA